MTVRLIDRPEAFTGLLAEIADADLVALDTEAASFHRYHDRIYLIQLSTRTSTAVIDPLGVGDLAPIGRLLADRSVEKVFHDADYDLRLFDKEFGFHATNLFDTRIAAQFLNEPGIGLAALLDKYFGLKADKRFQRADWSVRPLSTAMLEYAAGDTRNLCELRDILRQQLDGISRLSWVEEEFGLAEEIRWTASESDPSLDFLRVKGARALDRRALAILRALYRWRSELAASLDRAEFRIMGNEVMLHLAQHPVDSGQELTRVKGIGRDIGERRSGEILAAISEGKGVPDDELPRIPRPPRRLADPAYETRLEALKRERNRLATEFSLAPGVLCPNGTLEAIARAEPENVESLARVAGVRTWQAGVFGAALVTAMQTAEPTAVKEI
ncbi:MAG TPA: HRDC domain-containing protein [Gemmatimonadales bacterium]